MWWNGVGVRVRRVGIRVNGDGMRQNGVGMCAQVVWVWPKLVWRSRVGSLALEKLVGLTLVQMFCAMRRAARRLDRAAAARAREAGSLGVEAEITSASPNAPE